MPCLLHNCDARPASYPRNIRVDVHCHGGVQADTLQTLYYARLATYTDSMDGMDKTDILLDSSLGDGDRIATEGGVGVAEASVIRAEAGRRGRHILLVELY